MTREEFVKQFNTTDKRFVSSEKFADIEYLEILFIGKNMFFAMCNNGNEYTWGFTEQDWLPYTTPQEELFYWEYKKDGRWYMNVVRGTEKEAKETLSEYKEYRKIEFIKPSKD